MNYLEFFRWRGFAIRDEGRSKHLGVKCKILNPMPTPSFGHPSEEGREKWSFGVKSPLKPKINFIID
jgi:hypothetical protein